MKRQLIHPRKKQKILERDNFKCVHCGSSGDFNALEIDHITPVINGGTNDDSNLQTLCYKCNMKKRFGKNVTNKYYLNLTPLERLELVKERLSEYKYLTYAEFKVVFTQDELFKRLRIDLLFLNDLFYEISKQEKRDTTSKSKYIAERNTVIRLLRENTGKTYQELEIMLKKSGISLSYQQLGKICAEIEKKRGI